jgi:cell division protease FtsH
MSYYDSSGNSDYGFTKPYSEKTAELIDSEAKKIVADEYDRAKKILNENAAGHNALAELLIEKEVIFAEDLERIFGKRPWTSRNDELMAQNGDAEKMLQAENEILEIAEKSTDTDVTTEKVPEEKAAKKTVVKKDKKVDKGAE